MLSRGMLGALRIVGLSSVRGGKLIVVSTGLSLRRSTALPFRDLDLSLNIRDEANANDVVDEEGDGVLVWSAGGTARRMVPWRGPSVTLSALLPRMNCRLFMRKSFEPIIWTVETGEVASGETGTGFWPSAALSLRLTELLLASRSLLVRPGGEMPMKLFLRLGGLSRASGVVGATRPKGDPSRFITLRFEVEGGRTGIPHLRCSRGSSRQTAYRGGTKQRGPKGKRGAYVVVPHRQPSIALTTAPSWLE